jgi:hypothetical protein
MFITRKIVKRKKKNSERKNKILSYAFNSLLYFNFIRRSLISQLIEMVFHSTN